MKTNQSKIEKLISELCPNGVEFLELRKVADILNGYSFKSSKYSKEGIRVVRISDVQKGKMSDKDLKYYPIETEKEISRFLLKENDLVMSLTGNVGRVAMLSKSDLPAGLNQRVACIRVKNNKVLTRYLFHFFDQDSFEIDAMSNATGGGQKNMSTTWLGKYKIPIPPLAIQEEIVKILNSFTEIEAEIEAELEARKKQYEHYRSKLLTFDDMGGVQQVEMSEICQISRGRVMSKDYLKTNMGEYPVYSSQTADNGVFGRINTYDYDGEYITWTTDGAYAGSIFYRNGKFSITNVCGLLKVKVDYVNIKFLSYILETVVNKYVSSGMGNPKIMSNVMARVKVLIPPLQEQQRIVSILDKFDALVNDISIGLPAELKARRAQYEYYRAKLLTFEPIHS